MCKKDKERTNQIKNQNRERADVHTAHPNTVLSRAEKAEKDKYMKKILKIIPTNSRG